MNDLNVLLHNEYDKFNSATKYPSIETYHEMGERGRLLPSTTQSWLAEEDYYVTEKIDGTNARIIMLNGDYIIGNRETLLYAKGDRIKAGNANIVKTLIPMAEHIVQNIETRYLYVCFFEVYGGKVTKASKNYTSSGTCGCRMFDMAIIPVDVFYMNLNYISTWRAERKQFMNFLSLRQYHNIYGIPMVPILDKVKGSELPNQIETMHDYLSKLERTQAGIDAHEKPEGVVVRNEKGTFIRKLRLEDYQRTMRYNANNA